MSSEGGRVSETLAASLLVPSHYFGSPPPLDEREQARTRVTQHRMLGYDFPPDRDPLAQEVVLEDWYAVARRALADA